MRARVKTREFRRENFTKEERSRCRDVFLSVQATLREVKARKTPSASSDVGGVFVWRSSSSHPRDLEPCDPASLIIAWRRNRYGHFGVSLRGKVRHARVVGNLNQCDRVRGLPCRRDLSPIAKQQIAGSLSATVGRRSARRVQPGNDHSASATPLQTSNAHHATVVIRPIVRLRGRLLLFSWNEQGAHFPARLPR
jgi:hypothetical protein